jgi:hypothetical protein
MRSQDLAAHLRVAGTTSMFTLTWNPPEPDRQDDANGQGRSDFEGPTAHVRFGGKCRSIDHHSQPRTRLKPPVSYDIFDWNNALQSGGCPIAPAGRYAYLSHTKIRFPIGMYQVPGLIGSRSSDTCSCTEHSSILSATPPFVRRRRGVTHSRDVFSINVPLPHYLTFTVPQQESVLSFVLKTALPVRRQVINDVSGFAQSGPNSGGRRNGRAEGSKPEIGYGLTQKCASECKPSGVSRL